MFMKDELRIKTIDEILKEDQLGVIELSVSEDETGIYLDSNQGWVVEVVHWPRSPSRLKRGDARKMAKRLCLVWNAMCGIQNEEMEGEAELHLSPRKTGEGWVRQRIEGLCYSLSEERKSKRGS